MDELLMLRVNPWHFIVRKERSHLRHSRDRMPDRRECRSRILSYVRLDASRNLSPLVVASDDDGGPGFPVPLGGGPKEFRINGKREDHSFAPERLDVVFPVRRRDENVQPRFPEQFLREFLPLELPGVVLVFDIRLSPPPPGVNANR